MLSSAGISIYTKWQDALILLADRLNCRESTNQMVFRIKSSVRAVCFVTQLHVSLHELTTLKRVDLDASDCIGISFDSDVYHEIFVWDHPRVAQTCHGSDWCQAFLRTQTLVKRHRNRLIVDVQSDIHLDKGYVIGTVSADHYLADMHFVKMSWYRRLLVRFVIVQDSLVGELHRIWWQIVSLHASNVRCSYAWVLVRAFSCYNSQR